MASLVSPSCNVRFQRWARYSHPNLVVFASASSDFIDLVRDAVTVGRISQCVTVRNTERVHRSALSPSRRAGESPRLRTGTASIQSPNHNNAVVDVWQNARSINIGSKYVIPDIAGDHLICSLHIIPRYGTQEWVHRSRGPSQPPIARNVANCAMRLPVRCTSGIRTNLIYSRRHSGQRGELIIATAPRRCSRNRGTVHLPGRELNRDSALVHCEGIKKENL